MSEGLLAAGTAFWLGILTSVSPCLMATNVTAISFIARRFDKPRLVLLSGCFYTLGQSLAFVALAALLVSSILSQPLVAHWLQKYMFRLLGPFLVLTAMFLLDLLHMQFRGSRLKENMQVRAESGGLGVAALLGIVFAMSFCPTTAALFFGGLVPLAIARGSILALPLCYAAGVALPVMGFALLIALAAHRVSRAFKRVSHIERGARYATGGIFLLVGLYFTLAFTLEVL